MKKVKGSKGITLVALVITVIVLLILAGITISAISGENGIIQKAVEARTQTDIANVKEQARLDITELQMDKLGEEITEEELETILLKYGSFEESEKEKDILDRILTTEKGNKIQVSEIYEGNIKTEGGLPIKIRVNTGEDGNVVLPISKDEDCVVDWGDNTTTANKENKKQNIKIASVNDNISVATAPTPNGIKHTYTEKNVEKTVTISGSVKEIITNKPIYATNEKIIEIEQWGETGLEVVDLSDCENLRKIASPSKKSFENLKSDEERYDGLCFRLTSCSSLKEIPADLFKYCNNTSGFVDTFIGCTSLTTIPEELFADCQNVFGFKYTFAGCTSLTTIPEGLFANCPNVVNFGATFAGCTSLTTIPQTLFDNCQKVESFAGTFNNCTSLTGKPIELWTRGTNNAENGYQGTPDGNACYYSCIGLEGYEAIPDYWRNGRQEV